LVVPEVRDKKRLYHPVPAAIMAPNASDCTSRIPARLSASERLFTARLPVELPDVPDVALGLAFGAALGLGAALALGAGVAVTSTVAVTAAEPVAVGAPEVVGADVATTRPPAVAANLPANIQTTTTRVIVAMNEVMMPASHVDLGARNPAIIGGNNGTG
jgi:hypothetical protein